MSAMINLKTLKAINLASSDEKTRYYLNGVLLELRPGRVNYIATNGHILAAMSHETDCDLTLDLIVPSAVIESFKVSKRDDGDAILEPIGPGSYRLGDKIFTPIDGTFPDWRRVVGDVNCPAYTGIGKKSDGTTYQPLIPQFNPKYISTMGKIGLGLGASGLSMELHHNEASYPSRVTWDVDGAFGVIMPLKSPERSSALPDWVGANNVKEQIAA